MTYRSQLTIEANDVLDAIVKLKVAAAAFNKKPKYLIIGGESLARLNWELELVEKRRISPEQVAGLTVVRTDRDGIELGY